MTPHDIGWAVKQLWDRQRVSRAGWNGKGMFLFLVPEGNMEHPALNQSFVARPYVAMKTATDDVVPWLCSQSDLLATDWELAS